MVFDMALDKRFDYGFRGYQLPPTPRAARSARRRGLFKRKANDQQMCAFDLLATVAGKLLLDGDTCQPPANTSFTKEHAPFVLDTKTIIKEEKDEDKPLEEKIRYRDCCERNFLLTELIPENPNPYPCLNKPGCAQNDVISRPASGMKPYCSEKVGPTEQLVNDDCKLQLGIFSPLEVESSGVRLSTNPEPGDESKKDVKIESANNRNLYISDKAFQCSSGHVENVGQKSSALVCSVNNVKFPFSEDHPPCGSFPFGDTVKLVTRDDDENSFECTRNKAIKTPQRFGDGRFRKLLPSKHCRITSNVKDKEGYAGESSRTCPSKDSGFKWQRSLRDFPFKKRKLYECGSMPNSDEGIISTDRTCRVPENGGLSCGPNQPGVTPAPTCVPGGCVSFHSRNSQVKLKIKSFRVPELVIEIPETATVGSLKTTVMEAVNSVLGGGLHVGVLFQGKKIRDDNKTLAQTGISIDNKTEMVGFSLEPSSEDRPAPMRLYESRAGQMVQPLQRYPSGGGSLNESDKKDDAMGVVRKSKRCESAQRRIRRPFTVAEVEALVQAVEKLGTGRWRDVKLRAFDSAKHRTYVDLKDKWKTLVHTARISPQQRRGEPVPQQLLDRVLTAHAFWSQQQHSNKSHPHTS